MAEAGASPAPPKTFPVLLTARQRAAHPVCPRSVPWGMVAGRADRAFANHGETLAALVDSGGLDPVELAAVIGDRDYPRMAARADPARVMAAAVLELVRAVGAFNRAAAGPPAGGPAAPAEPVAVRPALVWDCTFCKTVNAIENVFAAGRGSPGPVVPAEVKCRFCATPFRPAVGSHAGGSKSPA